MKILLVGGGGMLAEDMTPVLRAAGHEVTSLTINDLDITDKGGVSAAVAKHKPEVIINCAAYTFVDKCEQEKELAFSVNADGAGNLAVAAAASGAQLVHFSTDFVFDGKSFLPYTEEDKTGPLCVYGESKLKGDELIMASGCDYLILRISWLFGHSGVNFPNRIISLALEKDELNIVYDQTGTPTYTVDLSEAVVELLGRGARGVYNFSNEGVASWYDFAYCTLENMRAHGRELKLKSLNPILTSEYKTSAVRPAYSVLDKTKYRKFTGKKIPHWVDALKRFIDKEFDKKK